MVFGKPPPVAYEEDPSPLPNVLCFRPTFRTADLSFFFFFSYRVYLPSMTTPEFPEFFVFPIV